MPPSFLTSPLFLTELCALSVLFVILFPILYARQTQNPYFLTSLHRYFFLLLNFPHVLSASLPSPRQHSPPPHQIPRPHLCPRGPHQSLRRPRSRPRLGPLLRRRQMGQRQAHPSDPSNPRHLLPRPPRSNPF